MVNGPVAHHHGNSYGFYYQFRYNFALKRGEVKIDRGYRQRCGVHGGDMVRPLVGEVGGGSYVMAKTMGYIRRRFYDRTEDIRRRSSTASDGDSNSGGLMFLSKVECVIMSSV